MKKLTAAAALLMVMGISASAYAAFDENLNNYTLDTVVVEQTATQNKFGDTITEQSYYRTGGDVKVITREEIENRHYSDLTEAIKRIPGVTFSNSGYRGGEYGYNAYNNSMSINGDSRVIICVDGRRVDNAASTRFGDRNYTGTRTMADLNQIISIDAIEKIEVIKGPGASAYGADATGGVINIISRKGNVENKGTVDLSTGSWKKHIYSLTYSGAVGEDKSWRYFINARRNMAQESKYKDGLTGKNYRYNGTSYKEESVNLRIDKDFNDKQNLKITYDHQNGTDGYPITARNYKYWTKADWERIAYDAEIGGKFGNDVNPGYRNLFSLDALSGSYNAYKSNDVDVTYTFNKDNGMQSFVRVYDQNHHYWGRDIYPDWSGTGDLYDASGLVYFPDTPEFKKGLAEWKKTADMTPSTIYDENNRGIQLQYGKSLGVNDVLASITYDKAKLDQRNRNRKTGAVTIAHTERSSVNAYVQDKIHINDKWDLTPAIRLTHFSSFETRNTTAAKTSNNNNGDTLITPSLATQYAFDDSASVYAAWTKIVRPMKVRDYNYITPNGDPLKDEKGDVFTLGFRKEISDKTSVAVHYDLTKMSNAITQYSVWSKEKSDWQTVGVNAKETKKSFNITAEHKFNDNWNLGLAYTHLKDKWSAKDGMIFHTTDFGQTYNVNTMINKLRPANHFTANLSYEKGKLYTGLLTNWYTGMSEEAFTCKNALVMDLSVSYKHTDKLTSYLTVTNLTNTAYENTYSSYNGMGAAPQYGRAFMVGMKYTF